jgi:xylulose-5-phosphate/fructose-6-phosphate phosphoketolase
MKNISKKQERVSLEKYNRLLNYLSVAQIFLQKNFLLEEDLKSEDIKKRLLGHWGTCPGISFVYGQINRQIVMSEQNFAKQNSTKIKNDFLFTVGTGHGFPAYQSGIFLDGALTNFFPEKVPYTKKGLEEVIRNFSTPFGYPSHLNPEAPGTILEGGELGYSLSVASGTVLDSPDTINFCLIGDGEAETGPLAASWNFNKFLSPKTDGAVLPILHLNGYKISGPTIFGRMKDIEIKKYFKSLGYKPYFIDSDKKKGFQVQGMEVFDKAIARIEKLQQKARRGESVLKPEWPVIILKTPKGMGCPKSIDEKKVEGNHLSHQVVFEDVAKNKGHLEELQKWLKSYRVSDIISFGENGDIVLDKDIQKIIPKVENSLGANKKANGQSMEEVNLPEVVQFFSEQKTAEAQRDKKTENSMFLAGEYLSEVISKNESVRLFSPDETYSNRLHSVFKNTKRQWQWPIKGHDKDFGRSGKVIEVLSEHLLFGMLWGYTLTGRRGYFATYEAFAGIVSSMADQYVKFLHASKDVEFRKEVPGINIILSSLLERQDHNGYSHQNPSFIANNLDRDLDLVNVYFPADKNLMLEAMEKTLKSKNCLNVIVAGKKMTRTWVSKKEARDISEKGVGILSFISEENPDVVVATAGDYVTEESVVGVRIFKERFPDVKVRFVNFFKLDILSQDEKSISSEEIMKNYLTKDRGIVFNYHGYSSSIKKLLFDYNLSQRIIVNGYREEGSTTSPFDMFARNGTSRFHLVKDLTQMAMVSGAVSQKDFLKVSEDMEEELKKEKKYIMENKVDPDYIKNW